MRFHIFRFKMESNSTEIIEELNEILQQESVKNALIAGTASGAAGGLISGVIIGLFIFFCFKDKFVKLEEHYTYR